MAKQHGASKDGAGKPSKKNLNVGMEIGEKIAKIAALRGKKMEDLFNEVDVQRFFSHLLARELEKEAQRLKGQS